MKKFIIVTLSLTSLAFLNTNCTKDKTPEPIIEECAGDTISYSTFVQPVLDMSCATSGCHNAASNGGGYTLENHAQVSANIDIILKAIKHDASAVAMPYFQPKLPQDTIDMINCWSVQGAQNN